MIMAYRSQVLVDTSVWIDYFNGHDNKETKCLSELMGLLDRVCLCGMVLTEVIQGLPGDGSDANVQNDLLELPYLEMSRDIHLSAAEIYRQARSRGKTIRSSVDCMIAACAIHHSVPLLHRDKDYTVIAELGQLKVLDVNP